MLKRVFILIITALFVVSTVVGQSGKSSDQMSIEEKESYLLEALDLMIIHETARSNELDLKYTALELIANALERGSTHDEIRIALEYLALENTQNPDVRRQAVKYLGVMGTKEAKTTLLKICGIEKDEMVLMETIKSLGIIGLNDNDDVVNTIISTVKGFKISDLLAIAAIDAIEKIAQKGQGISKDAFNFLTKIMYDPWLRSVAKERAKQVLEKLNKYRSQR